MASGRWRTVRPFTSDPDGDPKLLDRIRSCSTPDVLWTFPSGSTSLWSRNPSFCCADYSFSNSAGALVITETPDSWG